MVKDHGDGLTEREEVEIGIGDGVVPVDGAIVGVSAISTKIVKAFSIAACCAGVKGEGGSDRGG